MRIRSCLLLTCLLVAGCSQEPDGEPDALITAAQSGDLPRVDKLLAIDPTTNMRDVCQWTPLMKAALNGHLAVAERLLSHAADVQLVDKGGYSALLLAASNNHVEIVDLLAEHGADINRTESTGGWTALIWAAKRGHAETVSRLLELGADVAIRDHKGLSALDWALQSNRAATAELLRSPAVSAGAGG